jgi:predicted transcriptional regulator
MLRAHGLVKKVSHTHRYTLTDKGRRILPAILTANRLPIAQLQTAAS